MVLKWALRDKLSKFRMSPLDTWVLHLDNFGFKGKKGKFSRHTVIQIAKIKAEALRQLGFYNKYKIQRVRKSIDGLLEEAQDEFALAESIVVPTKEDYKILTKRILTTLQYAASIDFPLLMSVMKS